MHALLICISYRKGQPSRARIQFTSSATSLHCCAVYRSQCTSRDVNASPCTTVAIPGSPSSWCLRMMAPRSPRGSFTLAAQAGDATLAAQPVLVVDEANGLHASFLSHLTKEEKMTIIRINYGQLSNGSCSETPNTLFVMGGSEIEALGERELHGFCPIYLLSKGQTDTAMRYKCRYDFYLEECGVDRSARRLGGLLSALRGPMPSMDDSSLDAGMWSHFLS